MKKKLLLTLSYLFVAVAATVLTLVMTGYPQETSKLDELESLIQERFIG